MQMIRRLACVATLALFTTAAAPQVTRPGGEAAAGATPAAASAAVAVGGPANGARRAMTATDLDAWLDGFMPYALKSSDIAGAVVVVVKDGQVVTQRGFGYTDVAAGTPVDPVRTLMRPGSVAKLFTWTAVMQQVEQGRIDLDRDVNEYLDFRIPDLGGRPITMRHLMTHSAGFEEKAKRLITFDPARAMTLEAFVKDAIPARVDSPGSVTAYSNYGVSLAGYIVERVSGEHLSDYIDRHIFTPLGMNSSTFEQPLPDALRPRMAQGYLRASGAPGAFEIVNSSPAGAMTGSGADMARFMIAHLQNGRYGDNQILRPETVRLMHDARPITPTPPLPGMALGFYHEDRNGLRIIGHAGDTNFFHSELHLLPEENVGLYISMSSGGRDGSAHYVRGELLRRFVDRYYPTPHAPPVAIATAKEHGALMAGTYISTRRFDSTFLRMINVVSPVKVVAAANGDLTVSLFHNLSGGLKVWRETAPFQWREVNGDGRMAAVVKDGRVVAFASDDFPPVFVFRPAPIWVQWAILLQLAVAVLALTAALWPVSAILRWRFQRPRNLPGRERLAYHLSRGGAALDVVYVIGFVVFLDALDKDISILDTGSDPILRFLQFLGLLTIPAALAAGWNAWLAWRRRERGWSSRIGATVIAAAAVVIVGYTFALHILTVGLDY